MSGNIVLTIFKFIAMFPFKMSAITIAIIGTRFVLANAIVLTFMLASLTFINVVAIFSLIAYVAFTLLDFGILAIFATSMRWRTSGVIALKI